MPVEPYFGHERNVRAVSNHLPSVLLFLGPRSVGKWTLAEYVGQKWKFKKSDILRVRRLTQENARFVAKFASERPKGFAKLVIVQLDSKATRGAQNAILKVLEESPHAHFVLVAEKMPLATIRSRAILYQFGLLTTENVRDILLHRRHYSQEKAVTLAKASGGQVQRALTHWQAEESKIVVLKALDTVYRKDLQGLEALAARWDQEHTDLLVTWCYEALTGKWKLFIPEETNISGTRLPLRILMSVADDLRPRLVVRAALASVLQEQK